MKYIKKTFIRERIEYIEQEAPSESCAEISQQMPPMYKSAEGPAYDTSMDSFETASLDNSPAYYKDFFSASVNISANIGSASGSSFNSNKVESFLDEHGDLLGGNENFRGVTVSKTISRYLRIVLALVITFMIAATSNASSINIFKYLYKGVGKHKGKLALGATLLVTLSLSTVFNFKMDFSKMSNNIHLNNNLTIQNTCPIQVKEKNTNLNLFNFNFYFH